MIVEQIKTKEQQPTQSGWYDTDEGNLYWFNEEKEWSCRDDRISEEYPQLWYNPVSKVKNLTLHSVMLRYKCINCGNTCLSDHRPSNERCGGCDNPNWKLLKHQQSYIAGIDDFYFPYGEE